MSSVFLIRLEPGSEMFSLARKENVVMVKYCKHFVGLCYVRVTVKFIVETGAR